MSVATAVGILIVFIAMLLIDRANGVGKDENL